MSLAVRVSDKRKIEKERWNEMTCAENTESKSKWGWSHVLIAGLAIVCVSIVVNFARFVDPEDSSVVRAKTEVNEEPSFYDQLVKNVGIAEDIAALSLEVQRHKNLNNYGHISHKQQTQLSNFAKARVLTLARVILESESGFEGAYEVTYAHDLLDVDIAQAAASRALELAQTASQLHSPWWALDGSGLSARLQEIRGVCYAKWCRVAGEEIAATTEIPKLQELRFRVPKETPEREMAKRRLHFLFEKEFAGPLNLARLQEVYGWIGRSDGRRRSSCLRKMAYTMTTLADVEIVRPLVDEQAKRFRKQETLVADFNDCWDKVVMAQLEAIVTTEGLRLLWEKSRQEGDAADAVLKKLQESYTKK
ncbi:MAG: hypothetical protein U9M92_00735 [Patescibacteria group bacterium]|nr:hypothetical protein [Patescibacteria group bacterium]